MSDAETTRVTYVELARARGITVAAARRLTQRHKWPKQIGNDGFTRVVVPTSMLAAWDGDAYDDGGADASVDICDETRVNGGAGQTDAYVDICDDTTRRKETALDPLAIRAIADAYVDAWVCNLTTTLPLHIRRAVRALEETVVSLREQLATELAARAEDRERADRAESRAQEAEERTRALVEQLTAEQRCRVEDKEHGTRVEVRAEEAKNLEAKESEQRAQAAEGRMRDLQEQLTAEIIEHRRVVGMLTEQLAARRSWWPWRR